MTKKKRPRKFYIVRDGEFLIVNAAYFKTVQSRIQALSIGVSIFVELHQQLLDDAMWDSDAYIKSISLTEGYQRSLDELERYHPYLMDEIRAYSLKNIYST